MSRTRSGMLDLFDLTGLSDSDDDITSCRKRPRPRSNRIASRLSREQPESNVATTSSTTATLKNSIEKSHLPFVSPQSITESDSDNSSGNKDDDTIEIVGESNTKNNPFLDFPHRREDCQRFAFSSNPERFCRLCYCYVCDVPASECTDWYLSSNESHCTATHSDSKSKLKRRSVQMRKHTLRPRKTLLPPHRLRQPPDPIAENTVGLQVNRPLPLLQASADSSPAKSSKTPKRTLLVHNRRSKSAPDSLVSMRKSLRPRTEIQLPHRLRPSAGVLTGAASKQKNDRAMKSPSEDSTTQRNQTKSSSGTASKTATDVQNKTSASTKTKERTSKEIPNFRSTKKSKQLLSKEISKLRSTKKSKQLLSEEISKLRSSKTMKERTSKETLKSPLIKKSKQRTPKESFKSPLIKKRNQRMQPICSISQLENTSNQQPAQQKRKEFVSFPAAFALQHDLFLPGKTKTAQANVPHATVNDPPTTTKIDRKKRAQWRRNAIEALQSQRKTKLCCKGVKRKRSSDSLEHEALSQNKNLSIAKIRNARTKRTFQLKTSEEVPTRDGSATNQVQRRSTAPSSHFTRSHGKAIGTEKIEVHGSLGAYWRGEPTKYAGVPYQKRTNDSKTQIVPKKDEVSPSNSEVAITTNDNEPIPMNSSRIKRRRVLSPKLPTHDSPTNASFTATMEGTISYDADSKKYSILGTWYCPWSKSFPPQKFGLLRNLRKGEKGPTSKGFSLDGIFDGYCVVLTEFVDAKGKISYNDRLIFERGVNFNFKKSYAKSDNRERQSLEVRGSGSNKFGAFLISGNAYPCASENERKDNKLFTFALQKHYLPNGPNVDTENFPLPDRESRSTRSSGIHSNGTIVRKLFQNGEYHEGEVMSYDSVNKLYKIKFTDGGIEHFDATDMKNHYKHFQRYSHLGYTKHN